MTAEPRCWGGGGVSHPSQLTTGLVIKSVTTSPTLAGERMLFILQVSILSEQLVPSHAASHQMMISNFHHRSDCMVTVPTNFSPMSKHLAFLVLSWF